MDQVLWNQVMKIKPLWILCFIKNLTSGTKFSLSLCLSGVSIPLSNTNQNDIRNHAFRRAFWTSALWVIDIEKIVFQFEKDQLSFTYLISFLLLKQSSVQIGMGFLCILISDLLYRFFPVAGFESLCCRGKTWFNIFISGYEYGFSYCSPYALGCGFLETIPQSEKLRRLVLAGIVG